VPADFFAQANAIASHIGDVNPAALGLGAVCFVGLASGRTWRRFPTPR
jgi:hypothetical protein